MSRWIDPQLGDFLDSVKGHEEYGYDLETVGDMIHKDSALDPLRSQIEGFALATPEMSCFVRTLDRHAYDIQAASGRVIESTAQIMSADHVLELLQPVLNDEDKLLVGHNLLFDFSTSAQRLSWVWPKRWADTMVGAFMLDENDYRNVGFGLKKRVKADLGYEMGSYAQTKGLYAAAMKDYASDDAEYTLKWWRDKLRPGLEEEHLMGAFYGFEMPLLRPLVELQTRGVTINVPYMEDLCVKFSEWAEEEKQLVQSYNDGRPLDFGSSQAMSRFIYERLGLEPPTGVERGKNGFFPTNAATLEAIERDTGHPAMKAIMRVRRAEKMRTSYVENTIARAVKYDNDLGDRRARFNYMPVSTRETDVTAKTGRLKAAIIHQIPKPSVSRYDIRAGFIVPEGKKMVRADWSQLQLRIFAHYSGDPGMIEAYTTTDCPCEMFKEKGACRHTDIHQRTAEDCGCSRQDAKGINFGLIFGMAPPLLQRTLNKDLAEGKSPITFQQAKDYYRLYHEAYPSVLDFTAKVRNTLYRDWRLRTLGGRHRHFSKRFHVEKLQMKEGRLMNMAVNSIIQGTEVDIFKIAFRYIDEEVRKRRETDSSWEEVFLILQLHDEMAMECPEHLAEEVAQLMKECMERPMKDVLRVPLVAEPAIGNNWAEVY